MKANITIHYSSGIDNGPFLISDEGGVTHWIRRNEPFFFQKTAGRSREHIEEYAGFMIVSYTMHFSQGGTERKTMAYLFNRTIGNEGTLLCDYAISLAAMRRKIDKWWLGGTFSRKGEDDKITIILLP